MTLAEQKESMYGSNQQKLEHSDVLGGMTSTQPVEQLPEISREYHALRENVERLGVVVSELHEKLRPVLEQRPIAASDPIAKLQECYSDLGQGLNSTSADVRGHTARLVELMNLLAV